MYFQNKKNHIIDILILLLVVLHFIGFYYSFIKGPNVWSLNEAHINYTAGFLKRGLFGEIIFLISELNINVSKFFSLFYFIIYILQLLFIFLVLKRINNNIFNLVFLLSPTLFLFPIYDLGAYQRQESLMIVTILYHLFLSLNLYQNKDIYSYVKKIYFYLIPIVSIAGLFHEISLLSLSFHIVLLFLNIRTVNKKKINLKFFLPFLIPFFLLIYFSLSSPTNEDLDIMINSMRNHGEVGYPSKNLIYVIFTDINTRLKLDFFHMLTPINNFFFYLSMIFYFVLPFLIIFKFIKKGYKLIFLKYFFISIFPFILLFIVGKDWGRWISIICFILMSFLIIFNEKIRFDKLKRKKNLLNIIILLVIFQFTFNKVPHCCNAYQGKEINIKGGIFERFQNLSKLKDVLLQK